jgi:UDP-GlcNAc:undecaprenyl-phosphate GlcNAc-1-phosphate transferase
VTSALWLAATFGLSLTLALLITPLVIRSAVVLKLYDSPDHPRRMHLQPVPRLGGVAVYLSAAFVSTILFIRTQSIFTAAGGDGVAESRFLAGAFIGSGFLFVVGLVDDIRGLSPSLKLIAQLIAAAIAIYFSAHLGSIALGYGQGVQLGMWKYPLMALWIVGVTNVFNFIDGLNGLAGGIAVVAFSTIIIAAVTLGNFSVLVPSVALIGALIGFLRSNFPEAKIFLGDSGSLSIGFLIAVLSLPASLNASGAILFLIPIVAIAVPLTDGLLAIIRRWLRHVPVSGADARHIHHRLLAMGVSQQRAAIMLWALAGGIAAFGLLISLTAPFVATSFAILGFVGVAVLLIYGTNFLSYHELSVAGEVLLSAPSRARRVISDQIFALDVISQLENANSVEEIADVLAASAPQFGFLAVELVPPSTHQNRLGDHIHPLDWAWKLDYPVRLEADPMTVAFVLSIWCSPEQSARPYGAERVARVLGPAIQLWFNARHERSEDSPHEVSRAATRRPASRGRLRIK